MYGEETLEVPGTSGKVMTLRGKGVKGINGQRPGDQRIQVVVRVPKSSPAEELIQELATLQEEGRRRILETVQGEPLGL
ncbi:MAG: hypothetical protein H6740_26465 [Alphaproteobacteria bacterium]|nr:hypothetical protein [Alphaproteobacteria bacterium]